MGKILYPHDSDLPAGCTPAASTNNDPATRSWNIKDESVNGDWTKWNPWRSPGKAPVADPCGMASGYKPGAPKAGRIPEGFAAWSKGSEVLQPGNVTVWKAGSHAEVAWSVAAQHGGGYTYRLCPKKAGTVLTEECFQANPLRFVGSKHTIRYNDGSSPEFDINATQLTEGVTPSGSTWRMNPIPACNCDIGNCKSGSKGYSEPYSNSPDPISKEACPTGTMFPARFKNGAGDVGVLTSRPLHYSIVDQVEVPKEEGEYVLSWRWDCEETAQVWNSCADIRISSTEPPTPYPSPAPPAPPSPSPGPKPPTPGGKGCKAMENPTCKAVTPGKCAYSGCKKCHDDTTYDCDECCDGCTRTFAPSKGVHYCAGSKAADARHDDLVEFL